MSRKSVKINEYSNHKEHSDAEDYMVSGQKNPENKNWHRLDS